MHADIQWRSVHQGCYPEYFQSDRHSSGNYRFRQRFFGRLGKYRPRGGTAIKTQGHYPAGKNSRDGRELEQHNPRGVRQVHQVSLPGRSAALKLP